VRCDPRRTARYFDGKTLCNRSVVSEGDSADLRVASVLAPRIHRPHITRVEGEALGITAASRRVADEGSTALDVTIQAQILDLMQELQRKNGMAIILITHDLGVVARMADHVAVMYAGEIVERGTADAVFYRSAHPYTLGLRSAMPSDATSKTGGLQPIEGTPPDMFQPPEGCSYFARCPYAMRVCGPNHPPQFEVEPGHGSLCWLHHQAAPVHAPELYLGDRR